VRSLKIGVVGYSGQGFSEFDANRLLAEAFDAVLADHSDATDIWVVSGLTDLGIPALAYRIAAQRGWRTSVIACSKAADYDCFPVNEEKIVGANWGDESETFLREIDVLVRIGGGKQSLAEAKAFSETGKRTYEYELAAIPS
jgi:hypothetical protein